MLLVLVPLRCCPIFRSKEQARTRSPLGAPTGVPERLVGGDADPCPCASHAIAAAVGETEWERRQIRGENRGGAVVLSLLAWSIEYVRGSGSICSAG